jgi:hypothetical protein
MSLQFHLGCLLLSIDSTSRFTLQEIDFRLQVANHTVHLGRRLLYSRVS